MSSFVINKTTMATNVTNTIMGIEIKRICGGMHGQMQIAPSIMSVTNVPTPTKRGRSQRDSSSLIIGGLLLLAVLRVVLVLLLFSRGSIAVGV